MTDYKIDVNVEYDLSQYTESQYEEWNEHKRSDDCRQRLTRL